ncbi:MAG: outer membrane protein assembly factor BamD [Phycisphaerae bacterium]|nr:outer membrane protein assembly factor BamD [Phycisphaerae bacterium]NUQ44643.1 outer membrane protein assembly factor BamD [Phycisphaerae bacterium]
MMLRCQHVAVLVAVLNACLIAGSAHGQEPGAKSHAERLEYDPAADEWKAVAAPIAGTEDGDLELARALLAKNEIRQARKALKRWRKKYPDSTRRPEALFYSADVEVTAIQAGRDADLMRAYKWYEEILDNWAGSEWAERALRRELLVAEMFLFKGVRQWVWGGVLRFGATDEALEMLDRLIDDRAPGTPLAEQAMRLKSDYLYQAGEFAEAEDAYARLARDFPRGRFERHALLRSAQAANANFPGIPFDDSSLLEADERFRRFAAQFPDAAAAEGVDRLLGEIRHKRAEKEFSIGRYYERTKSPRAAIYYYRFVLEHWADTPFGAQARQRLVALGALPAAATIPVEPADAPVNTPAPIESPTNPDDSGSALR